MLLLQAHKVVDEVTADLLGVLLKVVAINNVEDGKSSGGGDGVTTVGVEVLDRVERIGNLAGSYDGSEGEAISNGLAHDDNIGGDVLGLEGPEVGARAAESGLDLIGDANTTGLTNDVVGLGEVVLGVDNLSSDTLNRLVDEGSNATIEARDDILNLVGVLLTTVTVGSTVDTAVWVGDGSHVDVTGTVLVISGGLGGASGQGGRDTCAACSGSVVGVLEAHDGLASGVDAGKTEGKIVGFAATVDEVAHVKGRGELTLELLGVGDNGGVQVAGVAQDVLQGGLGGGDEVGVAVTNVAHIAVAVNVLLTLIVEAVLHAGLDEHEGVVVEMILAGAEMVLAAEEHLLQAGTIVGLRLQGEVRARHWKHVALLFGRHSFN